MNSHVLIDTHTHLYSEEFDADRHEVMARALECGVSKILLPAVDSKEHSALMSMVDDYEGVCYPMMGLHPTSVDANYQSELAEVSRWLAEYPERFVAIGEIGLDYYWDITYAAEQNEVLRCQLRWALERHLPVSLHLRNAKDGESDAYYDFFHLIEKEFAEQQPGGVLHCFSGTVKQASYAVSKGFYLGIGGVVTYKNSLMADVVAAVPIENIVLETDAPYLAPVPHRGKRNESAYIVEVARKVAAIKDLTLDEVARQTTQNAEKLFFSCVL